MKWIRPLLGITVLLVLSFYAILHRFPEGGAVTKLPHVRVGTNRAIGTVTPYIANDQRYFDQRGIRVDIRDFNDITTMMESITSGQLDIALVGISSPAIWLERGVALKVVASANGGGHVLLTRSDTGVQDLKDLKGKKIATPKPGTVTDTLFRAHILEEEAHLDPERDVKIIPNMAAADLSSVLFGSREVEAAITWEPFASQAEAKFKDHVVLLDVANEWKHQFPNQKHLYPVNVVVASQAFIDQHPDALRRFLAAYCDGVKFLNDKPEEANKLIARETHLDEDTVRAARKRIDFTASVNVEASQKTLAWSQKLGYLKHVPLKDELFDLRFLPGDAQ